MSGSQSGRGPTKKYSDQIVLPLTSLKSKVNKFGLGSSTTAVIIIDCIAGYTL